MKFTIPLPLQHEHEALHEELRLATQADGEVGEAAQTLAHLMHPHFVKEDQFALPPLGLLAALARGEWSAEMAEVLTLTEQLEAELPQILAEHKGHRRLRRSLDRTRAHRGRGDVPGGSAGWPGGATAPKPARVGANVTLPAMQTPAFFDAVPAIIVADSRVDALDG